MSQSPRNSTEHPILTKNPEHIPQISFYINALRTKYTDFSVVLDRLDLIATKIDQVPSHVQHTVTEMLKADLENKVINTGILTAAIMAINPKNAVLQAANDDKFALAA
jgi:hypothetical protein